MQRFRKIFKKRKIQMRVAFAVVLISSFAMVITDALFRTTVPHSSGTEVRRVKIVKHPTPPAPYNSWEEFRKTKAVQHANTY